MRKDCTIDNRKVIARNASTLGHCRNTVKRGDCFTFADGTGRVSIARSLGRVSAPSCGAECPAVTGYVLAMVLSSDATFAFERWVNPDDITRVVDSPARMAAFFFAPQLPYDTATMRRLMGYGTTQEQFIEKRAAMFAESAKCSER